jgi:protein-tyrosine phosphatase
MLRVVFVCLGNICRSPTAEAVFRHKAQEAMLELVTDSAGTAGYHIGARPDKRSMAVAQGRGYHFDGIRCRKVADDDFILADLIIAMDNANLRSLLQRCPEEHQDKVKLFMEFADSEFTEVPDPYYGGIKGFELVLDLIEQASDGLVEHCLVLGKSEVN